MKCPVCHSNCREDWETCGVPEAEDGRRASWWAGQYECRQCGTFTASGTRQGGQGGEMLMHVWHPVCPLHGHTCLRLAEGRYTCGMLRCRLQWNVRGKRLVVSKIGELAREAAEGGALKWPWGEVGRGVLPGDCIGDNWEKVEGYLAHKWGLTDNLPSNHPYKNKVPT